MVWQVTAGPDSWIGTRIAFTLRPWGHRGTTLLFTHSDWREAGEFMSGCSTNWGAYLTSLKAGAETGAFAAFPAGEISRWGQGPETARLERTYDAPVELVWEMLTTAQGLDQWWNPDGFETRVTGVDLKPGGELRYTLTATSPEQVAFMRSVDVPLSTEISKTFTEVAAPTRLAYLSVIDFVPDHEPIEHLTTIDLHPDGNRTTVIMTLDPLQDEAWTKQHHAHRGEELDHLEAALKRHAK